MKNQYAKSLSERKYHQRIVFAKKGKGSYNRKKVKTEVKKHA